MTDILMGIFCGGIAIGLLLSAFVPAWIWLCLGSLAAEIGTIYFTENSRKKN